MSEPTRGEFDMLSGIVKTTQDRLTMMDSQGTKGIGIVQAQLSDLVKDVIELKGELNSRFTAHEKIHEADQQQRRDNRRWLIGTAFTAVMALTGIFILLIDILTKTHGGHLCPGT